MPDQNKDGSTKRQLLGIPLSETLLLAAAPVVVYALVFVYQVGYFDAFGIPLQFMTLTIVDVLVIGSRILGAFALIFGLLNLFASMLPSQIPSSLQRRILQALPIFLLGLPWLLLYKWGRTSVLFSFLLMFVPPLLTRQHKGTYLQRMEALDNRISFGDLWEGSLVNRLAEFVGHTAFVSLVYLVIGAILTYHAGKSAGVQQEVFFLASSSPGSVVLFMTSDQLVVAPLDRGTRRIERAFTIVNIANESRLTLRPVALGPLTVRRSTAAQRAGP